MAAECVSYAQGTRMRVTRVDECGNPPASGTECSLVTSSGFVTVSVNATTETGTDIVQKNAAGELCINTKDPDLLRHLEVEIEFCEVDPDLFEMISHVNQVVRGSSGGDIEAGFELLEGASASGFALEVWLGVPSTDCSATDKLYGYMLLPWVLPQAPGNIQVGDAAITFTLRGFTRSGGGWGVGPYDVSTDAADAAAPLQGGGVSSEGHAWLQTTTVAPPAASCGCAVMP